MPSMQSIACLKLERSTTIGPCLGIAQLATVGGVSNPASRSPQPLFQMVAHVETMVADLGLAGLLLLASVWLQQLASVHMLLGVQRDNLFPVCTYPAYNTDTPGYSPSSSPSCRPLVCRQHRACASMPSDILACDDPLNRTSSMLLACQSSC